MIPEAIPVTPTTRAILVELADRTGRPVGELLDAAVATLRQALSVTTPVSSIPGVNPADVWEAAAQADAGMLTPHDIVFDQLRQRRAAQ